MLSNPELIASCEEIANLCIPPLNFAVVAKDVYRSGYPNEQNSVFLRKLRLRSIVYLCEEPPMQFVKTFAEEHGIQVLHFGSGGNQEPFQTIPLELIESALGKILDVRNHPLLIHCNKGTHRTGCLIGCLRKVQQWSLTSIFDEYRRFARNRHRVLDQQYIELFDAAEIEFEREYAPSWL